MIVINTNNQLRVFVLWANLSLKKPCKIYPERSYGIDLTKQVLPGIYQVSTNYTPFILQDSHHLGVPAEAHAIPQGCDKHLALTFLQPFLALYVLDHRGENWLLGQRSGFRQAYTLLFCGDHRLAHATPRYAHPGGGGAGFRSNWVGKNHRRHGLVLCGSQLGPDVLL